MTDFKNKLLQQQEENKTLLNLVDKYNLSEYRGRWQTFICTDKSLLATDVEFTSSCGCCRDSVVYARAFFRDQDNNMKIYIYPVDLCIGENNFCGYGIIPGEYDASHLPQIVQDKITQYLEENIPEDWEDEDYD